MVHIYFFSNTSACMQCRGVDLEFKRQDLRNSIKCVLFYNSQIIDTIIGAPAAKGDDPDTYFSVIVDKDDSDSVWFDLFADAVVFLLKFSLSVYVPPFEDSDVIIG